MTTICVFFLSTGARQDEELHHDVLLLFDCVDQTQAGQGTKYAKNTGQRGLP